jgi:hypothetical protein
MPKLNRLNTISEIDSSLIIPISDDSNTAPLKKCTIAQLSSYFNSSNIKVVGITSGAGASCKSLGRGSFSQTQSGYTGIASVPSIGAVEPASASSSSGGSFTYIG